MFDARQVLERRRWTTQTTPSRGVHTCPTPTDPFVGISGVAVAAIVDKAYCLDNPPRSESIRGLFGPQDRSA